MESIIPQIKELMEKIKSETKDYDPILLAEQNIDLSRLYGNLTEEIATLEHAYDELRAKNLDNDFDMKINKLDILARKSDEHLALKNAQGVEKALIQMIRANSRLIKIKENEISVSKYQ